VIEREMVLLDSREDDKTAEINRYYDYTNKEVEFEADIERSTRHHMEFWSLLLDKQPDIRIIE
jgi:hypothetical protein